MQRLLVVKERAVSPVHCLAATTYMMEAVGKGRTQGAPMLKISLPDGEAVALGRYQRASSAINGAAQVRQGLEMLRRLTGGSTAMLGAGRLHLSLALPDRTSPLDCEPRQFLQRYGAGVIRGLVQAGLKARYFGKDLLSVENRPIGIMSFELAPEGPALLEVILGLTEPWHPDPSLSGYPPRSKEESGPERATRLCDELDTLEEGRLVGRLERAIADLLELEVEERDFTPLEAERIRSLEHRAAVEDEPNERIPAYMRQWSSRPIEEAIGFVEASVRLTQGRFLRDVWLYGDFMADSGGMEDLQERLKMAPVKRRPVALVIDDVLGAPEHVIIGIRRLGSILEAILDASKRATEEGATGKKQR